MATIAKISNGASASSALNYALGQDRPIHEETEKWLKENLLERPQELENCRAVAVGGTNGIDPFIAKEQFEVIRQLHNQTKEVNQVLRITQSFALDELNLKSKKKSYGIIIANIICLLSFLVVGVLLGQWVYKDIWNGWGLYILFDTIKNIQPEHSYGAIVLGIVGFSLIALGIYGSFRLMYEASTTWLDQRPKIFKKIFPKK